MIKVGVIGVGSMGENHARVYFHSDDAVRYRFVLKQKFHKIL